MRVGPALRARDGKPHPNAGPPPPPAQILYNGQSVEVDGHSMQKLIANLQPNTEYSFVLMNRGSSAGGLQHLVSIRTAPDLLPHKPLPASAFIEDGRFTLSMPHVQDPSLIRCAQEAGGGGQGGDLSLGEDRPDPAPSARPGGSTSWWCPLTAWEGACWRHDGARPRSWSWTRCLGTRQGGPDDGPIAVAGCGPGDSPKPESLSGWQPAPASGERDAEVALGSFRRTPGGLTETAPEGFAEHPLGWGVVEASLETSRVLAPESFGVSRLQRPQRS